MDSQAIYHTSGYKATGAALMLFAVISKIHQHLGAFHCYAYIVKRHFQVNFTEISNRQDPARAVGAHHLCTCVTEDFIHASSIIARRQTRGSLKLSTLQLRRYILVSMLTDQLISTYFIVINLFKFV